VKDSRPPEKSMAKGIQEPFNSKAKHSSTIKDQNGDLSSTTLQHITLSKKSNPTTVKWHSNGNIQDAVTN